MSTPSTDQLRFNMIEQQIRPWDVLDPRVLELLATIRREEFVPPAHRALAFVDMETPLRGHPEEAVRLGQIMLAPKVEARLVQEVSPRPHEKVLEVGAGSGHMAALLAGLAQRVITLEIEPELARMARDNLQRAGVRNAEVREADGARGLAAEGPFDVIVLSGSVAEVPSELLQQLKVGGRLAAIVGAEPMMRGTLITRTGEGSFTTAQRWDTVAPRLLHFPAPSRFQF
ncbi:MULTISPECIES: protein-L-isoaspartate O-methyltransferase family protein [Ramlibacter]|uniref:Protein-L-isoaspartate O-methyltransferase n=1 Tax=Ramlibacter pinisoli TaxID=2682844 RepID=A0A6N8ITV7_9BURK|nr:MULTISPECIES: protein-L-isoaspartate O-methyltransferase [Ramlibacter]MBA2964500.1 protein-L-isoaspartate O-methyltransferase [Ramlibacter sp. CGMCC 1.13660]MVQ29466.1 methyltransferase domain-containing protein [Ramlibacter pinisoli]